MNLSTTAVTQPGARSQEIDLPTSVDCMMRVRSNMPGMLTTITRAELAAFLVALRECRPEYDAEVVATDSRCSMDKIAMHLRDPTWTINDLHRPMVMLEAIMQLLINHAHDAQCTRLIRIKSHIGIGGNEHADMLPDEAAELVAKGAQPDRDVSQEYCEDLNQKFWPQTKIVTGQDEQTSLQNIRDLDEVQVHNKLKLGQSNQDSIYYRSWQDIQPFSSSKYSNAFWTGSGITRSMMVNVLKWTALE